MHDRPARSGAVADPEMIKAEKAVAMARQACLDALLTEILDIASMAKQATAGEQETTPG